jgi:hypothetical protein
VTIKLLKGDHGLSRKTKLLKIYTRASNSTDGVSLPNSSKFNMGFLGGQVNNADRGKYFGNVRYNNRLDPGLNR